MTDPELQKLADLWQEPDGADEAKLTKLARKARRKARLMGYGDAAWLLVISVIVVVTTWLHPHVLSVLAGVATLAMALWLNWRRRSLRRMSGNLDTSDRPAFLASMTQIVRNDLRRVTFSLLMLPPALLVAVLFRIFTRNPSDPLGELVDWATSTRGVFSLIAVAALVALTFRSRLKLKAQLEGLKELQKAYSEEGDRDEQDDA